MRLFAKAAFGALAVASLGFGIDAGTPAHARIWVGPRGGVAVTRGFYGRGYYGGYRGYGYRGYGYGGYYRPYAYGGYYRPYAYGPYAYGYGYRHPLRFGYYRRW